MSTLRQLDAHYCRFNELLLLLLITNHEARIAKQSQRKALWYLITRKESYGSHNNDITSCTVN